MELIFILIFVAVVVFFLSYGFFSLVIKILNKFFVERLRSINRFKKISTVVLSAILTVFIIYFWLFRSISYNYKQAYISKGNGVFVVMVFGKREIMGHDPFALLIRETNEDSLRITIPRYQGVVSAIEVLNTQSNFKYVKGNIVINKNKMTINLDYIDAFYKNIVASGWNGNYELVFKNN